MAPWLDRSGRFSFLKAAVLALLLAPGCSIAWGYGADALGPRPLNAAIHQMGLWTIRLLFVSLAITPARQLFQWSRLVQVRRMIGVAAFAYAALHLTLYAADQMFDLAKVASEIVSRIYLAIGFLALLGLAALAVTSTDRMLRRLGGARWRALHRLTYGIALLGAAHFFLQSKLNVTEPLVMAGFLGWLLGYRLIDRWFRASGAARLWPVVLLAVAAGLATALGEAMYFHLRLGVDPLRVLAADLSPGAGLRPAWVVLGAGAALLVAVAAWRLLRPGGAMRRWFRRGAVMVSP